MQEKAVTAPEPAHQPASQHEAFHAYVYGSVQGVGFRYFVKANAQRAGVTGWVRNQDDGTVEVWAEGTKLRLQQLIGAINRGPTHGHVTRVDIEWKAPTGDSRSFYIRY